MLNPNPKSVFHLGQCPEFKRPCCDNDSGTEEVEVEGETPDDVEDVVTYHFDHSAIYIS